MAKLPGYGRAVGYWGRRPDRVVALHQVGASLRVALEDKLIMMGRPVGLWLVARPGDPGVVPCTCVVATAQIGEAKCRTCWGSKRAPGNFRFGYETVHVSSSAYAASPVGWVLTGTVLDTTIKPYRLVLAPGALSGTVVTPATAWSNPQGAAWESDVAAYRLDGGGTQTILVEVSLDGGVTWSPLSGLAASGAGTIRFRVTLTRTDAGQTSPAFEIVRARHPQPDLVSLRMRKARPDLAPGTVLVLKTWVVEQVLRTAVQGRQTEKNQDRSWTCPLDMFLSSIPFGSVLARISDQGDGPHNFFRPLQGLDTGTTFVVDQVSYNDQIEGLFTYQAFSERAAQPGEAYGLVW